MPIPSFDESQRISDPKLPKDQLGSIQRSTIVDVLGEGEIEGFPSATGSQGSTEYNNGALKDVFLNGTQVLQQSASNTNPTESDFNFTNINFEPRFGTSSQTHISGISDIETETTVSTAVTNSTPVSRSITNANINAVRVTIAFQALQKFEDNGDIVGTSVDIRIQIIQNNGTTTTPIDDRVTGKTPSAYFRDYRINIPSGFSFPITVRVIRDTADSSVTTLQNGTVFSSFTEIIDKQNAYQNTAHVGIRFDAEQFPAVPQRMYRIRGLKIKIPHNSTVRSDGSLSFAGTFNGTLKSTKEYCNDPAWVLYDLLTSTRFGFGDHITEDQLDKYAFYSASVYNSELISDNEGGTQPRFSCNAVIQNQQDAYRLIGELCSVMRVQAYYQAGSITITQDRPTDPSYLFTLANVLPDGFSYTNTSKRIKYTVINVQFFDNETREFDYETVEDTSLQDKFGFVVKNIRAFAVTSRGMAHRLGKWFLYTQANEGEVVSFTTTLEAGTLVRVGAVISIADPVRSGLRTGGRIKSATTTVITVDDTASTNLDATNNATLSVILPDGSVETKTVSSISGADITVGSAFSATPNANSVWVLENDSLQTQQFRVVGVTEVSGLTYQITAVFHNSGKYSFVEDGTTLPTRTITTLTDIKSAPSGLSVTEKIVVINNRAVSKLFITWNGVAGVNEYQVQFRFDNGNFTNTRVSRTDFEILNSQLGTYEIRVFSINAIKKPSALPATVTFNAVGKTAVPANVQNLRIEPINNKLIRLRWDASTDTDVLHGGFCRIRHSSKTDGTGEFAKAVDIDKLAGNSTDIIVPYVEGEYFVRFVDDGGRISAGSASVVIDLPDPQPALIVQTRREDQDNPKFQGTKTNVDFDATTNSLNLIGGGNFDDITDFDTVASLDDFGGISPSGTYDFNETLDLGAVFSLDLKHHFLTEGFYPNDLIDSRTANIDTWTDFDGTNANDVNAELLVRVTQDDPSGSPTYTAFQTFVNGVYKGRGFQFRANLTSNDPAQDIRVAELGYTATLQRRTEQSATAIASGSGVKNITFSHPFFVGTSALLGANSNLPSIGITAQNMATGDFFEVSNVSSTGFSVHFKNSSNASISRNFNFTAVGFGKGN
jgi:predicted phage tail protein